MLRCEIPILWCLVLKKCPQRQTPLKDPVPEPRHYETPPRSELNGCPLIATVELRGGCVYQMDAAVVPGAGPADGPLRSCAH